MTHSAIDLEKFKQLKKTTKLEYEKIGSIYSPAVKGDIVFSSNGFHHLSYDGSRSERSKNVQRNKFIYFKVAVDILKKSTTIQEYRRSICPIGKVDRNGFRKTKTVEWFSFFSVVSFSKCIRVKAIIRRIGSDSGIYHFWSVMPYWTLSNSIKIIGSKEIEDE